MNLQEPLPKSLILIGFMGSGKSTVGRELHHRLGYELVDMDSTIEQREGRPISRIFEEEGEEYFRNLETNLLKELHDDSSSIRRIISTGGGVVSREENRDLLKNMGYVVWLHAPVKVIYERTSRNRERPLLNTENPIEKIESLLEIRNPWYEGTAHLKVDTAGLDGEELAVGILESARYFFAKP